MKMEKVLQFANKHPVEKYYRTGADTRHAPSTNQVWRQQHCVIYMEGGGDETRNGSREKSGRNPGDHHIGSRQLLLVVLNIYCT
jgi:hypothetical protein